MIIFICVQYFFFRKKVKVITLTAVKKLSKTVITSKGVNMKHLFPGRNIRTSKRRTTVGRIPSVTICPWTPTSAKGARPSTDLDTSGFWLTMTPKRMRPANNLSPMSNLCSRSILKIWYPLSLVRDRRQSKRKWYEKKTREILFELYDWYIKNFNCRAQG